MVTTTNVLSGLLGVCVGDALGVPVEFTSRTERLKYPVSSMLGYGTWNQPPGTWSDDSSLTLCLAECLCDGFSLDAIAKSFWRWYKEGYWAAHGEVFDIGNKYPSKINLTYRVKTKMSVFLTCSLFPVPCSLSQI